MKTKLLRAIILLPVIILTLSTNVFAAAVILFNVDYPGITNRKLLGKPTSQYEDQGVSAPALSAPIITDDGTACIIIGDSRAVGLDMYKKINETEDKYVVFAGAGMGYGFMENIAFPAAARLEEAHPEISHWKYIICMGVNDLENLEKYKLALSFLGTKKDVTFVSVNPVEENPALPELAEFNLKISEFNEEMKKVPNIKYYDTNSYLKKHGYKTVDNMHYDGDTIETIYELIKRI
ncbi:MAG: hypothetical protein J6P45_03315 [Lachnospiraceae bacterium]|nr:hypothetical protein [Lachnospiraceae bacterium]MBR1875747.1 hypothetical protein [Lachnospiraceae bacterium]